MSTECAAASGAGAASGLADMYAVFTCVSTYLSSVLTCPKLALFGHGVCEQNVAR